MLFFYFIFIYFCGFYFCLGFFFSCLRTGVRPWRGLIGFCRVSSHFPCPLRNPSFIFRWYLIFEFFWMINLISYIQLINHGILIIVISTIIYSFILFTFMRLLLLLLILLLLWLLLLFSVAQIPNEYCHIYLAALTLKLGPIRDSTISNTFEEFENLKAEYQQSQNLLIN